ncbi:hypothetical protein E2C01_003853 [Portunus trituberculatus]|uniref:Uncharacterized protein n=1 Tax=Portunus trituberculatus TaxID=210409 RepID=A0A5B7CUS8_PORTR|nr:hypothetical protein [Portunus trituberculatus]
MNMKIRQGTEGIKGDAIVGRGRARVGRQAGDGSGGLTVGVYTVGHLEDSLGGAQHEHSPRLALVIIHSTTLAKLCRVILAELWYQYNAPVESQTLNSNGRSMIKTCGGRANLGEHQSPQLLPLPGSITATNTLSTHLKTGN